MIPILIAQPPVLDPEIIETMAIDPSTSLAALVAIGVTVIGIAAIVVIAAIWLLRKSNSENAQSAKEYKELWENEAREKLEAVENETKARVLAQEELMKERAQNSEAIKVLRDEFTTLKEEKQALETTVSDLQKQVTALINEKNELVALNEELRKVDRERLEELKRVRAERDKAIANEKTQLNRIREMDALVTQQGTRIGKLEAILRDNGELPSNEETEIPKDSPDADKPPDTEDPAA